MARRETLELKRQASEAVANETRRCLHVLNAARISLRRLTKDDDPAATVLALAATEIAKGCPYIEFYPELLNQAKNP